MLVKGFNIDHFGRNTVKKMVLWLSAMALVIPGIALAEPAPAAGPGAIMQFVMLGGFVLIFYFLLWRPQSKRAKEHRELIGGLGKGDEVVTSGGVVGKVTKVTDEFIVLQVSDNVELKFQKASVSAALPKGTIKEINSAG